MKTMQVLLSRSPSVSWRCQPSLHATFYAPGAPFRFWGGMPFKF
jgi:hypothetical protein